MSFKNWAYNDGYYLTEIPPSLHVDLEVIDLGLLFEDAEKDFGKNEPNPTS